MSLMNLPLQSSLFEFSQINADYFLGDICIEIVVLSESIIRHIICDMIC